MLGYFNIKKWHMELITWNLFVSLWCEMVHRSPMCVCVCFSFSSRLSCLISRCSKFVLQHFTKCEKSIQFHSHSMSFCLIFVLQMEKMSVWNVFAMFPMSIYSISFHFSFASNITKMEFRTLKLAKQICTYTYIVLCKMWFHFFPQFLQS